MFTGIVQNLGVLIEKTDDQVFIKSKYLADKVKLGDSVSCNGACLSVASISDEIIAFDVMGETFRVTNLGHLEIGCLVNIELAMGVSDRFDGHIVSGHIDFVSELIKIDSNKFYFAKNLDYDSFIAKKGSITINGVSLTVVDDESQFFTVSLIPLTFEHTNFKSLIVGNFVNVEIDLIARYIQKLIKL